MKQALRDSLSALGEAVARLDVAAAGVASLDAGKSGRIERLEAELYEANVAVAGLKDRVGRARNKIAELRDGIK